MENNQAIKEDEIDLGRILKVILKKWYILLICAILGGGAAFGYTYFMVKPTYQSTSRMMVLSKETTLSSLADLQIGSQLTGDYTEIITSRDVLNKVITELDLNMDYKALSKMITIDNPSGTRILDIKVTDTNPERAADIVNTLAENSVDFITEVMEVSPPNIFSKGIVPTEKSGPNTTRNSAVGAILGIILAIIIVVIGDLMDERIRTEEDIEKYLGLTVLASIPDRETIKGKIGYYGYGKGGDN